MTYDSLSPNQLWRNGCVYCGVKYDLCRDHVIPTSYLRTKRRYGGDWLVTACTECNTLLGAKLLFNVPERAAYLKIVLARKYYRILRVLNWDDDELEELGENLSSAVRLDLMKRKEVERRLSHLELVERQPVDYLSGSRPLIPAELDETREHVDPEYASFLRRKEVEKMAKKRFKRKG